MLKAPLFNKCVNYFCPWLYLKTRSFFIAMECKRKIVVNGLKFRVHPVYNQYAASKCGKIVSIDRETILLGNPSNTNYLQCTVRAKNTKN